MAAGWEGEVQKSNWARKLNHFNRLLQSLYSQISLSPLTGKEVGGRVKKDSALNSSYNLGFRVRGLALDFWDPLFLVILDAGIRNNQETKFPSS